MRTKIVSLFAVLFLITACETTPDDSGSTAGTGTTTDSSGTSSSSVTSEATSEATTMSPDEATAAPTPGTQEDLVVNVGDRVFFDFDKSVIAAAAEKTLKRQAAWMKQFPNVSVTVEGHCDERGTREYNLALGDRRANSIRDYLVALGVDANRMKITSFGKERPVDPRSTTDAWSQNRRGVLAVD